MTRRLHPARRKVADVAPSAPLRVAVGGLPGAGVSVFTAALRALGRFELADSDADMAVRVIAEAAKPEDHRAIAEAGCPVLLVLTKADTCALGPGGPVEAARRRCVDLSTVTGMTAEPVVGLLARAALDPAVFDDDLLAAVRVLTSVPADLRTAEAFVACPHPVPVAVRQRLLEALDLFGIAHAVVVLRGDPAAGVHDVRAALRRASNVDPVVVRIAALGAEGRYRRLQSVLAGLRAAAITDAAVATLLTGDDVVLAQMDSALAVMRAAGAATEPGSDHLARARHWNRYVGAAPVSLIHQACAGDIVRGSLRLWRAAG